jgi:two-component system OmpR family response regulator/two-component system response regulator MprA
MVRILLVEDEPHVAAFLRQGLMEEGFDVDWVMLGRDGIDQLQQAAFDLVLLDVRLPDLSGIEVCRQIRLLDPALPVLMLTALDAVEDRVAGLRAGADDYLPKPFAFEELLARIEALHRRATLQGVEHPYRDGPLALDPVARECLCDEEPINLTQKEFDLLAYFMMHRNQALARDAIHLDVWGYDFDRGTNLIDVYVGYLRRKLEAVGCTSAIETVRGIGYRYRSAEENSKAKYHAEPS